jgi:hypothetical protein
MNKQYLTFTGASSSKPGPKDFDWKDFEQMKKYQSVTDGLSRWYPAVIQAEALFGTEAKEKIDKLYSSVTKLFAAIKAYHECMTSGKTSYGSIYTSSQKYHNRYSAWNDRR